MEVMTTEAGGEQAQQQQVFLYKLVQGRSGPSFGVFCARLCGVPAQVRPRPGAALLLACTPVISCSACSLPN